MFDLRNESQCQFKKLFHPRDIHAIRAMIDDGYEAVKELYALRITDNFLLDTHIGRHDIRAHLLRAAIASSAKKYCQKGVIGFSFSEEPNAAMNCRHIKLSKDDSSLYLARVERHDEIPHKTLYRPVVGMVQGNLFEETDWNLGKINTYTATYGDGGEEYFRFGNIGILGESNWWYCEPLEPGAYKVFSKQEKGELLVELNDELLQKMKKSDEKSE